MQENKISFHDENHVNDSNTQKMCNQCTQKNDTNSPKFINKKNPFAIP